MFPETTSPHAEALGRFRRQMVDYARGHHLVELRGARSQEAVANEIGVSAKSLRAWEHSGGIRWHNVERLAEFYGVDPEELVEKQLDLEDPGNPQLRTLIEEMRGMRSDLQALLDVVEEDQIRTLKKWRERRRSGQPPARDDA